MLLGRSRYRSRWSEHEPADTAAPPTDRSTAHPRGGLPRRSCARAPTGCAWRASPRRPASRRRSSTTTSRPARSCCGTRSRSPSSAGRRRSTPSSRRVSTGPRRVERMLLVERRARRSPSASSARSWNEVWSSLRSDDELRPLVERSYRAWLGRVVDLIEEGRPTARSPRGVDAATAGLAARGGGRRPRLAALPRPRRPRRWPAR